MSNCLNYDLTRKLYQNIPLFGEAMAKVCELTGKRPMSGNTVSHSNNKTKENSIQI